MVGSDEINVLLGRSKGLFSGVNSLLVSWSAAAVGTLHPFPGLGCTVLNIKHRSDVPQLIALEPSVGHLFAAMGWAWKEMASKVSSEKKKQTGYKVGPPTSYNWGYNSYK